MYCGASRKDADVIAGVEVTKKIRCVRFGGVVYLHKRGVIRKIGSWFLSPLEQARRGGVAARHSGATTSFQYPVSGPITVG